MSNNSEFSRIIDINDISKKKPLVKSITATDDECRAIAQRLDISKVKSFQAEIKLSLKGGGLIKAEASYEAEVEQECSLTLKPIEQNIEGAFKTFFTEKEYELPVCENMEYIIPQSDEEAPETIEEGQIDLGDLLAQYLALELDHYPKSSDADFKEELKKSGLNNEKLNPFAVLANLNDDKN